MYKHPVPNLPLHIFWITDMNAVVTWTQILYQNPVRNRKKQKAVIFSNEHLHYVQLLVQWEFRTFGKPDDTFAHFIPPTITYSATQRRIDLNKVLITSFHRWIEELYPFSPWTIASAHLTRLAAKEKSGISAYDYDGSDGLVGPSAFFQQVPHDHAQAEHGNEHRDGDDAAAIGGRGVVVEHHSREGEEIERHLDGISIASPATKGFGQGDDQMAANLWLGRDGDDEENSFGGTREGGLRRSVAATCRPYHGQTCHVFEWDPRQDPLQAEVAVSR